MEGTVRALYVFRERGRPGEPVKQARFRKEQGMEGDRHADGENGHRSDGSCLSDPSAALTLPTSRSPFRDAPSSRLGRFECFLFNFLFDEFPVHAGSSLSLPHSFFRYPYPGAG